jgi:hypothetical protein
MTNYYALPSLNHQWKRQHLLYKWTHQQDPSPFPLFIDQCSISQPRSPPRSLLALPAPVELVAVVVEVVEVEVAGVEVEVEMAAEVAEEEVLLANLWGRHPSHGMGCEAFPRSCSKETESSLTPF